jgi:hypothetical protein
MLPIEIVNIILGYVSDLNNDLIITQYHLQTNKEYYKINFHSDLLWNIKSTLLMKHYYRLSDFSNNKGNVELDKFGKIHYENQLREKSQHNV